VAKNSFLGVAAVAAVMFLAAAHAALVGRPRRRRLRALASVRLAVASGLVASGLQQYC
jgi:hypothetical protein